ncbi:MAG TPA: GspMb/PilO family protein [Vicinamibacterales bacterium]|nr:GspMb/PilO family protein [Vicinamibacterales bacterium]
MLQRALREQRTVVIALALALVANLALYGLVVYPLSGRVAAADVRAAAAEQSRRAATAEFAAARAVATGKEQAEAELKTFYDEILPDSLSAAQRATYVRLAQLARDADIRMTRRLASAEAGRRGSLDRLEIAIALEGDYQDLRRFIYQLETAPSFLVIDRLALEEGAVEGDTLRLSLTVSTYYRATAHGS